MNTESSPATIFHVSVFDTETGTTVLKQTLEASVLTVSSQREAALWLPGMPDMQVSMDASSTLLLKVKAQSRTLESGSTIRLPRGWRLSYELSAEQGESLLKFEGPVRRQEATQQPAKRKVWPRVLSLFALVFVLSLPFWVPQMDRSEPYGVGGALEPMLSPGPLHPAHANATESCSDCHQESFASIPIEPCLECHTMKRHLTREQTGVHPLCVTCHKEHEGEDRLIIRDQRLCTQCHETHSTLDAVLAKGISVQLDVISGFPESHPPFSPVMPDSGLKGALLFSHKQHLQKDLNRDGKRFEVLECASCHEPDERGVGFLEPVMEQHCGGACHVLERQTENGLEKLEHANLLMLFEGLAQTQRFAVAEQHCSSCHAMPEGDPQTTETWSLWEKQLAHQAAHFENIRFSHKQHEGKLQCLDCHAGVNESTRASDVLLPELESCSTCHLSEPKEAGQVETPCASCHTFHTVDWD